LDKLQTFSQNLSFTETVDGSADEVTSLKDQLKGFSTALTIYDEKLSMLIEGSVRRVVRIEKGEEWVKGFTIRSVSDVVNYVRGRIGQTEQWAKRGTTILGDLLRNTVGHLHTATFLSPKDVLMLIGCTHPSSGIVRSRDFRIYWRGLATSSGFGGDKTFDRQWRRRAQTH
jgi:hypothetical protein